MKSFTTAIIATCLLSACQSTDVGDTEVAANDSQADLVCEHRASTGSHLKKRTCMKKSLAKAIQRESQESMRRAQEKGQSYTDSQ